MASQRSIQQSEGGKAQRNLSKCSMAFDVEDKGFLTPAQERMRSLDTDNTGYLANHQVAEIVEQTLALEKKASNLKNTMFALIGLIVVLSLSNLGTGIAAAWLAKDTSVDGNGVLHAKGSDAVVTTVGMGKETHISITKGTPEQLEGSSMCVDVNTASVIWNSTMTGIKTTALVSFPQTEGGVSPERGLAFSPNGALFNETHACVPIEGSDLALCLDFTMDECDEEVVGGGDRLLRGAVSGGEEITHHDRRKMFEESRRLFSFIKPKGFGGRFGKISWF